MEKIILPENNSNIEINNEEQLRKFLSKQNANDLVEYIMNLKQSNIIARFDDGNGSSQPVYIG